MVERVHQTIHNMIAFMQVKSKANLDEEFVLTGMLSTIRAAMRATVHTITRTPPSQLVFGRDTMLNVLFKDNWQYIKDCKQKLILQNNERENAKRIPRTYNIGDKVMIRLAPSPKQGHNRFVGPHTLTAI